MRKRLRELPPIERGLEYQLLADQLDQINNKNIQVMSENGDIINDPDYYSSRKNEISLSWVNGGGGARNGNGATIEENFIWHANMPIGLNQCREVYDAALRGLPKKVVQALVFADYDLEADEAELFEIVYEYGQAKGLLEVANELFEGAKCGDPRAVKMYLEVSGLLNKTEDDEAEAKKKLMRITMEI